MPFQKGTWVSSWWTMRRGRSDVCKLAPFFNHYGRHRKGRVGPAAAAPSRIPSSTPSSRSLHPCIMTFSLGTQTSIRPMSRNMGVSRPASAQSSCRCFLIPLPEVGAFQNTSRSITATIISSRKGLFSSCRHHPYYRRRNEGEKETESVPDQRLLPKYSISNGAVTMPTIIRWK